MTSQPDRDNHRLAAPQRDEINPPQRSCFLRRHKASDVRRAYRLIDACIKEKWPAIQDKIDQPQNAALALHAREELAFGSSRPVETEIYGRGSLGTSSGTHHRTKRSPRKPTRSITCASALNILNARDYATSINTPLNTWMTICFIGSRFYPGGDAKQTQIGECRRQALLVLAKFMAEIDLPPTYVFAVERARRMGPHIHILAHLPVRGRRRLLRELRARYHAAFKWPASPQGAIRRSRYTLRPVDIKRKVMGATDAHHELVYLLKGTLDANQVYSRARGEGVSDQGELATKRSGVSRRIDQAARRSAGYDDKASINDLDANRFLADQRKARRQVVQADLLRAWKNPGADGPREIHRLDECGALPLL